MPVEVIVPVAPVEQLTETPLTETPLTETPLAEAVATGGLLLVILRAPVGKTPALVASYIGAAYWFTASTSFANPAAVFGRMMSDSFAGIAPHDAPGFVLAQLVGALGGLLLHKSLGEGEARP